MAEVEPGWEQRWREFHHGVAIGPLWIGPPWEAPPPGTLAVVVDPGRAFGTGAHPTTRLTLELLLELPRRSLLDVGCGSGVLAIAAAKLGFGPVTGVDAAEPAIAAARANAAANGVELELVRLDALVDPLPRAEIVLANIALAAVEALASRLECDALVASGYLVRDTPTLPGWRRTERRKRDGWVAELYLPAAPEVASRP